MFPSTANFENKSQRRSCTYNSSIALYVLTKAMTTCRLSQTDINTINMTRLKRVVEVVPYIIIIL